MTDRVARVADVQIKTEGKRGTVIIDGHDISTGVTYVGIAAPAGQMPTVTLHVAMPTVFYEGKAEIEIPHAVEAALVRLGWTPPDGWSK